MRRKNFMGPAALGMAVSLSLGMPATALAVTPEFGRSVEEWETLRDNVLEYGEIEDLVYEYNVTVRNNSQELNKFDNRTGRRESKTHSDAVGEYLRAANDAWSAYENAQDGATAAQSLVAAKQNEKAAEDQVLEGDRNAQLLQYKQTEKGIAKQAQAAMNTYFQLQYQLSSLEKNRDFLAASVTSAQGRQSQGMATYADVLNAQQALQNGEAQIIAMKSQIEDTRQNLIVMLGWKQGDMPEIRPIPAVDMGKIAAMNVETDTSKAIAADYTLQLDQKSFNNSNSEANREIYRKKVENDKQEIAIAVNDGYQKVLQAKNGYDEAVLNVEVETKNWNAANIKYQLGSISRIEYLQAETNLVKAQMDKEVKNLELFQAIETYDWIVKGVR
ncbi:MAG: TolC family protein [Hungatella sp.]|nr:TolC family protein [Hungatella sp.]